MKFLVCMTICLSGMAVTTAIYMSVESLGRRAIPALVRAGTRGGISSIQILKNLKLRIPAHGPPVHVYPTEHVRHHVQHSAHVVAEPEPEVSHSHVHVSHAEPHYEPIHEPHHSYSHLSHLGHYGGYGHLGHLGHHGHHSLHGLHGIHGLHGHQGHIGHIDIGLHGHHGHDGLHGFNNLIGDHHPLGLGLGGGGLF